MANQSLVSVIMPFFNAGNFIHEAIESVLAQTYDHWELLLVDDGAHDGSARIAINYAERYPGKVRYLHHEGFRNKGACASRNLGVRRADGVFIALLDADDVWFPRKLEEQVAILESHPEAAMVYGPSQYWYSWTGNPDDMQRDYVRPLGLAADTLCKPPTLLTLALESKAPTPCPSDIIVQRRVVDSVGGFEEQFRGIYQLYEDQAFLAKVCLEHPVFVSSECWDKYRQHPDSCVSVVTARGKKYTVGLFYLEWLERYLSERAINDDELWRALRSKQFRYRFPNFNRLLNSTRHRFLQTKEFIGQIGRRAVR